MLDLLIDDFVWGPPPFGPSWQELGLPYMCGLFTQVLRLPKAFKHLC